MLFCVPRSIIVAELIDKRLNVPLFVFTVISALSLLSVISASSLSSSNIDNVLDFCDGAILLDSDCPMPEVEGSGSLKI